MGVVIRPRFGLRACFECDEPIPAARARILADDAAAEGRLLLKSDYLCVDCQRRLENQGAVVTRRPPRR